MKFIKFFFLYVIFCNVCHIFVLPVATASPTFILSPKQNLEDSSFKVAETLFKSFEYGQALLQYKDYLSNYPKGYFVDEAIFQMAESYRFKKNYFMAIRYYQLLHGTKIKTDLYNDAKFKIAICYVQLGHYKNALRYLKAIYSKPNDKKRLWEIVFMMGKSFEGMGDSLPAFEKYLQSLQMAPDEKLKQKSENQVLEMIQNKLNLENLMYLAGNMDIGYPLGQVLFRLSEIYEVKRDYTLFQKYLDQFLNEFPGHELYKKGREKLDSFIAKSETSHIKTKIGVILPLSGRASENGQKFLQGIQLAYNLIPRNKRKNIELVVKDSGGIPEKIPAIMEELGTDNDVVGVVGPMFSRNAKIAIEKAKKFKLPMISPYASSNELLGISPFFFRNCLTNGSQGKAIAEYAINNLEMMKFVVLFSSGLYGSRLKNIFLKQVNILGGEVIASESYTRKQSDFKEQILHIGGMNDKELKKKALELVLEEKEFLLSQDRELEEYGKEKFEEDKDEELSTVLVEIIKEKIEGAENPLNTLEKDNQENTLQDVEDITDEEIIIEVIDESEKADENEKSGNLEEKIIFKPILKVNYDGIFIPGYPDEIGLIAPQLAFYNIENIQLLGGNSWNSDKIIELGGKYVRGAIFVDGFFPGSSLKQVQKFNERYQYFFGEAPNILAAQAFDAAKMVFDIILKNRIDREGIKNGLMEVKKFEGVSGETTILPNGDSEKSVFFITIKKNKRTQLK